MGFGLFGHTCVFIHILPALPDVLSYPLQIQHADPTQNFPCNFGKKLTAFPLGGGEIFPAVESSSKSAPPVPHSLRLFCFFGKYFTAPFISTGSPCCKAAGWNTFTLIVFYFITLESAALVSVYRTGSLLGTTAGAADGWA